MSKLSHLCLFSGIGGFALAARWAGFETVQFVEIDSFCQKVLKKHWPDVPIHGDIKTFNPEGHISLLTGGFPCQPFSVAGHRKGKDDDRYLWPEMFRVAQQCKPTWIVMENVPGIIHMLNPIIQDLENEEYTWWGVLIAASEVGAPHKRERLWIVAYANPVRCDNREHYWEKRHFQAYRKSNLEALQQEWPQFIPQSWATFNAQDWFIGDTNSLSSGQTDSGTQSITKGRNTREGYSRQHRSDYAAFNWEEDQPPIPGVDDGLPQGLDRNRALGNAIVPQVVYPILKFIHNMEYLA